MDQWPYVGGLSFPIQRHFVLNPIYDDLDGMLSRTDHKAGFFYHGNIWNGKIIHSFDIHYRQKSAVICIIT